MIIDLLRHGEVVGEACFRGHTDEPLSKAGWQQMTAALDGYEIEKVVCSPLIRCADFTKQWSIQKNIIEQQIPEFKEINFGDWDGLTAKKIQKTNKNELDDFWTNPVENTPPNGENLLDFQKRVLLGWNNLIIHNKNKNTLLVTHGGVIKIIMSHVLSIPLNKLLSIEVPLASMTRIRISFDKENNQYSSLVFHAHLSSGVRK